MKKSVSRGVDGVLLLDKPSGISSHAAVQRARSLFGAARAGHTGTLDPLATGLLPVCLGEATKFARVLLGADKTYLAAIRLGLTTTTGDLEGEMTSEIAVNAGRNEIEAVLKRFVGELVQVPPMYSAIKKGGEPLYKLARAGHELPRTPRRILITELTLLGFDESTLRVSVTCSKGTYIRALAEDIGRELGCGACLAGLRRTAVGGFSLSSGAVTLERLESLSRAERDAFLLPPDSLVAALPRCELDAEQARRLSHGQAVEAAAVDTRGLARIYGPDRRFLGVGEVVEPGRIVPRRLTSQAAVASPAESTIA